MKYRCGRILVCGVIAGFSGVSALHAQPSFPRKPVTIVVPYGPGGGADFFARVIAPKMGEKLGQPVLVENKPGAGTAIAATDVARSVPDGHRLLLGDLSTFATNQHLYRKLSYDPIRDFTPITLNGRTAYILVVNPTLHPYKNVDEFVSAVRKAPADSFSYGSAGSGGPAHLTTVMLERASGIHMVHVAYKGTGPALPDLLSGQIGAMFTVYSSVRPFLASGKLRALGTGAPKVQHELPGVAAIGASFPGFESWFWMGMVAPSGTPKPVVDKVRDAYAAAVNDPGVRRKLEDSGVEPLLTTGEQMAAYIRTESARMEKIIKSANISLD